MSNAIVLPALVLLSAGLMRDAAAYSQEEVNMFDDTASPTIYTENAPAQPEPDASIESSGKYTHLAKRGRSSGEAELREEKTSHH